MEEEKRHDEMIEEVVKRLIKNNLYVKLEKYKWKVEKVGFLGVVIRLEDEGGKGKGGIVLVNSKRS